MSQQPTHERTDDDTGRPGPDGHTPRPRQGEADTAERSQPPGEKGGPKGPEPTRFGDWEKNGRCFDF